MLCETEHPNPNLIYFVFFKFIGRTMSFTGPAPDHELEMKAAKYSRGKGADLEDGGNPLLCFCKRVASVNHST